MVQIVKNLPVRQVDPGWVPRSGRSPGERNGYPLSYSCLENSMHGQRSLVGYSLWGPKEWDTTEQLTRSLTSPKEISASSLWPHGVIFQKS